MNHVTLTGRLTRDPETRYTQSGKAVTNFSIAVDDGYGDNKKTMFVPVVVWDKLAEVCANNLQKGRKVLVEGRLQISEYERDGQKRRAAEIVAQNIEFLEAKKDGQVNKPTEIPGYDVSSFGTEVFPEEDIPF